MGGQGCALAAGEATDRLWRRDPAVAEQLGGLDAPVLRGRKQQLEDLRPLEVVGRVKQDRVDRCATRREVALEDCLLGADRVRDPQRVQALLETALGRGGGGRGALGGG